MTALRPPPPRFLTLRAFRRSRPVAVMQVVLMTIWLLTPWNIQSAWIPSSSTQNTFVPGDTPVWDDAENPPEQVADTADIDSDGLPNWYEDWLGLNRYNPDTDGDLITDFDELTITATNPFLADSDSNGRGDLEDWLLTSAPDGDYDNDGISNSAESASTLTSWQWVGSMMSNSYTPSMFSADTNGDGWTDGEDYAGLSAPGMDPDNDGLSNEQEGGMGTYPKNPDSDGDGLSDGFEVQTSSTGPLTGDTNGNGRSDYDDYWNPNPYNPDPYNYNDPNSDMDGDGLVYSDEVSFGTNPTNADSDSDGLNDGFEVQISFTFPLYWDTNGNWRSDYEDYWNPLSADPDGDGLTNSEEVSLGTDSNNADTDGDTLYDGFEANASLTNPLLADTDTDGLGDGAEWSQYGTSPLNMDTDRDGMDDGIEVSNGRNPLVAQDTDGDGLADYLETGVYSTNPDIADTDTDGLSDGQEVAGTSGYVTDPLLPDSDGDYLSDGYESTLANFPYGQTTSPIAFDSDQDGLRDDHELYVGTNPWDQDSDNDGLTDGEEVNVYPISYSSISPLNARSLHAAYDDWYIVSGDSDSGGIPDAIEQYYGMDLQSSEDDINGDLDSDSVTNLQAYQNGWDLMAHFNPNYDSDNDGMTNVWEIAHGLNPNDSTDAYDDPDGDFLFNVEEYLAGTDLDQAMTNGSQGDFEIVMLRDLPGGLKRGNGGEPGREYDDDWDSDGVSNRSEMTASPPTDPRAPGPAPIDSDGDGYSDNDEIAAGTNPFDSGSNPGGGTGTGTGTGTGSGTGSGTATVIGLEGRGSSVGFWSGISTGTTTEIDVDHYFSGSGAEVPILAPNQAFVVLTSSNVEVGVDINGEPIYALEYAWTIVSHDKETINTGGGELNYFFQALNPKYGTTGLEILTNTELTLRMSENTDYTEGVTSHLEFDTAENTEAGRLQQSSGGYYSSAGYSHESTASADFPNANWTQVWLKASAPVTEKVTQSFLLATREGSYDISAEAVQPTVQVVTLTIEAGHQVSTSGMTGELSNGGIVSLKPVCDQGGFKYMDLTPVELKVWQSEDHTGPSGSRRFYINFPKDEPIASNLFALWPTEEATLKLKGLDSVIQSLPSGYIDWKSDYADLFEITRQGREVRFKWNEPGLYEVELKLGATSYKVYFDVPDVGQYLEEDMPLIIGAQTAWTVFATKDEFATKVKAVTGEVGGCRNDAIKHGSWSAWLSQEFGLAVAKQVTDAHEGTGKTVKKDFGFNGTMDLHNNSVGMSDFQVNRALNPETVLSKDDWVTRMATCYSNGDLWIWWPKTKESNDSEGILRHSNDTKIK